MDPRRPSSDPGRSRVCCIGLGSAAAYGYAAFGLTTSNRLSDIVSFLGLGALLFAGTVAAGRALRRVARPSLGLVLVFAGLFRLLALGAGLPHDRPLAAALEDVSGRPGGYEPFLLYDNDLWRYLWDGHVTAEGHDPYGTLPQEAETEPALAARLAAEDRWVDVLDKVSFQDYASVYPPATQGFFALLALVAPASALVAKGTLAVVDLALCALLAGGLARLGRRPEEVLAYAWNPAVVLQIAGSGHPDVLMMAFATAAALLLVGRRPAAGGALLGGAVLTKLAPVVLLPAVLRRLGFRGVAAFAGVTILGWLPLRTGIEAWWRGLRVFRERWTFNSGPWAATEWLAQRLGAGEPEAVADLVTLAALAACLTWLWRRARRGGTDRRVFLDLEISLAALVLLSPAVMPWYVLWPLPFAVLAGDRVWPAFTVLALLSYLTYADPPLPELWKWVEYGGLAILWVALRRGEGALAGRPDAA